MHMCVSRDMQHKKLGLFDVFPPSGYHRRRDGKMRYTAETMCTIAEHLIPKQLPLFWEGFPHGFWGPGSRDLLPLSLKSIREVWNWSIKPASQFWTSLCTLKYCHVQKRKKVSPNCCLTVGCALLSTTVVPKFLFFGIIGDVELKVNTDLSYVW